MNRPPSDDRLPPHSIEAEQGVLGCCMLEPILAQELRLKISGEEFYDLRHSLIFSAMLKVAAVNDDYFNVILLNQFLRDRGELEQCGGMECLTALADKTPSAGNLQYYLEILLEKFRLRKIIQVCTEVTGKIYDGRISDSEIILARASIDRVFQHREKELGETMTWKELQEFDTDNDPNCVIGWRNGKTTRYLCRGNSVWIIAPSGIGKSSISILCGIAFCAGLPLWGITPMKALRVLVVQAENDRGDVSEMCKGIKHGLKIETDSEMDNLIEENFKVRSIVGKIGENFCVWLKKEIIAHRADLVIVDPLLSFAGVDLNRTDQTSKFCREWMDPVLKETGAVMIGVHHTGKPMKRERGAEPPTLIEMAYAGIGSSELVNWARAVILIQQAGDTLFRLMLAKRGRRAWATHPNGEPTQMLWLRHSTEGIFWEQVNPPEESDDEKSEKSEKPKKLLKHEKIIALGLGKVIDELGTGVTKNELCRRIGSFALAHGLTSSKPNQLETIATLCANGAIHENNDEKFTKK